jgi:DNA-binding CsgD family transcriptional regulator
MPINEAELTEHEIELLALAPNEDPGDKYKDNDVLAGCPICHAVFWQRSYLVDGKPSPQTCGLAHGQVLRAREREEVRGPLTDREAEMLKLAETGLTSRQIGDILGVLPRSAKNAVRIARLKTKAA